jgi:hypothetical protein
LGNSGSCGAARTSCTESGRKCCTASYMVDLLSSWLVHRAWHSQIFHDQENERDQVHIGLIFGDILCTLAVVHDHAGYIRCSLIPIFNLDTWKREQAEKLLESLHGDGFRLFRDSHGYLKFGVRTLLWLADDQDAIRTIDQAANEAIRTFGLWVDDLKSFCTTNISVDTILEARASLPSASFPAFRIVIDPDSFERLCDNYLATTPSNARSFVAALRQSQEQRDGLRRRLEADGFVLG